jgi:hypothetical protein
MEMPDPVQRIFKTQLLVGKVMLALFLDAQGQFWDTTKRAAQQQTVSISSEMLWDQFKPTI